MSYCFGGVRNNKCLLICGMSLLLLVALYVAVTTTLTRWKHVNTPFAESKPIFSTLTTKRNDCSDIQLVVKKTNVSSDIAMHKYLNIFNASEENKEARNSISSNKCVPLQTTVGKTPICIYDPKIDIFVSGSVVKGGMWEKLSVHFMASFLKENPDMQLLDIGSNIGVFTLQAATMGRKVIAVDANKFNLRLLAKSLHLGELQKNVTLVWNAITDIHETINLTITTGNIGGSFVKSAGELIPPSKSKFNRQKALAITLEDLVGFLKGKPVFMKIDIEGSEWKAFRGGEIFFQDVDVRYILMEWTTYKKENRGRDVIRYMSRFGYQPFAVRRPLETQLNVDTFGEWPGNVLWVKN